MFRKIKKIGFLFCFCSVSLFPVFTQAKENSTQPRCEKCYRDSSTGKVVCEKVDCETKKSK